MAKIFKKLENLAEKFYNSKIGKVFSVFSSNAVSRAYILVTIPLILAGVVVGGILAPLAPAIAIPLAVIAITSVIAGIIIDTKRVRSTRRLLQENRLLKKLNLASQIRREILHTSPILDKALASDLIIPATDLNINSLSTQKYPISSSLAKTIANQATYIPLSIIQSINDPVSLVIKSIKILFSFGFEVKDRFNISQVKAKLKTSINEERKYASNYNDLKELAKITREQRIQTLALRQLSKESYSEMNSEQIRQRFTKIKAELELMVKNISRTNKGISIIKDFSRANNPLSKYNNATKIKNIMDKEVKLEGKVTLHQDSIVNSTKVPRISNNHQQDIITKSAQKATAVGG